MKTIYGVPLNVVAPPPPYTYTWIPLPQSSDIIYLGTSVCPFSQLEAGKSTHFLSAQDCSDMDRQTDMQ